MTNSVVQQHNGVRFTVEAVPRGNLFVGRFAIIGGLGGNPSSPMIAGNGDSYRPTMENHWATEAEA